MKIKKIEKLAIPDVKVITFFRHCDKRGYFAETYRKSVVQNALEIGFPDDINFLQCNESFSYAKTVRGLHFQWNPYMAKLVRTITGRMLDIVLDIRKGSSTYGKALLYDMQDSFKSDSDQWIWVPSGFAHGNVFLEDTIIEYLCTGEYNQHCEVCISPFASDIDWSLCDIGLRNIFLQIANNNPVITEKDKDGFSVLEWQNDGRSDNFLFARGYAE